MRVQAILRYEEHWYGIFMGDISDLGVGFYSPVQLFPTDLLTICLPDRRTLDLVTEHCVCHANNCCRCGATLMLTSHCESHYLVGPAWD